MPCLKNMPNETRPVVIVWIPNKINLTKLKSILPKSILTKSILPLSVLTVNTQTTIFLNFQSFPDSVGRKEYCFCHCFYVVHLGPCCNMSSDTILSRPHPLNRRRGWDQHHNNRANSPKDITARDKC